MKRETSKHPKGEMSAEAKEEARLRARAWYVEHKEQVNALNRRWVRENPEKRRATAARWVEKNPEKVAEINRTKVANRIAAAPVIHDADRFERIEEAMRSNREKRNAQ